ncbi:MAG: hypothetical protein HXY49_07785 [Ignavibacteriaceae bacterium]|nr:hypothetical protein [Ignavibacteriaceae bacterium]
MKKNLTAFVLTFVLVSFCAKDVSSQNDCCGVGSLFSYLVRSGISGGYGIQQFDAEGLNNYISVYNQKRVSTLTKKMDDFGLATGFRVGANLFQVQYDDILFGLKLSYQWMKQENEATATISGATAKREYELKINTLGVGTSFSYILSKHFDIKIIDLLLTWTSAKFINRFSEPGKPTTEETLESPESSIGVIGGTGIVFYPLPPYVSIELNIGYSMFSVDEMQFSDGTSLQVNEDTPEIMTNFISAGGFFAFAQLNLAVPL